MHMYRIYYPVGLHTLCWTIGMYSTSVKWQNFDVFVFVFSSILWTGNQWRFCHPLATRMFDQKVDSLKCPQYYTSHLSWGVLIITPYTRFHMYLVIGPTMYLLPWRRQFHFDLPFVVFSERYSTMWYSLFTRRMGTYNISVWRIWVEIWIGTVVIIHIFDTVWMTVPMLPHRYVAYLYIRCERRKATGYI